MFQRVCQRVWKKTCLFYCFYSQYFYPQVEQSDGEGLRIISGNDADQWGQKPLYGCMHLYPGYAGACNVMRGFFSK